MKTLLVFITLLWIFFPGITRAENEDWDKLEQELNIQLEELDQELKLLDEQLSLDENIQTGQLSKAQLTVNLINSGVISGVRGEINENMVEGESVYVVEGYSVQKLFGIWDIEIDKRVIADTATGEVLKQEMGIGTRILDIVSF